MASRMPAMRSESALFIWQPKVVIQYSPRPRAGFRGALVASLRVAVMGFILGYGCAGAPWTG